jgi:glycosyltransferase involved in cell wall biosynthesis
VSVLVLAQGPPQVASSRTRVFAYLPYLAERGVDAEVLVWNSPAFVARQAHGAVPVPAHVGNLLHRARVAGRLLGAARRHQTIYVQKVVLPRWFLRAMTRGGRRLVFDYDDALYALAPGQDAGLRAWLRRRRARAFTDCLREADLVLVENDANRTLTEPFCRHTVMITGPIDTERYRPAPKRDSREVTLGWIGSPSTTVYLHAIAPALAELARRRPVVLALIGAAPFDVPGVTVRRVPWSLEHEVAELGRFDIGLMPLSDDPWSRGKGGYKILQYMAMGLPTVASPVGINRELVDDGRTGRLASSLAEWVDALDHLAGDAAAREAMGAAAREAAVARYSLAHYAPVFLEALVPPEPMPAAAARAEGVEP